MKLVDANVLLYALNEDASSHERSRSWLDAMFAGQEPVAFAWVALVAFLRLSTRVGVFPAPLSVEGALEAVRSWMDQPPSTVLEPTSRHLHVLAGLLNEVGTGGNLVNDAHLAALAIEHDATVVTFDNDFDRFPGVRWQRPG